MSSRTERFHCTLRRSPLLRLGQAGCVLAACAAVWLAGIALPLQCLLTFLLFGYGLYLWRCPEACTALRHDDNGWWLRDRKGHWLSMVPRNDTLVTPHLIVLRMRVEGCRLIRSQCIPSDVLDADTHRRLRVRLRFTSRIQGASMVSLASSRSSG